MVEAKLGIALILHIKGLDLTKVSEIRVSEPECQRDIGIAWVEGRYLSPAAELFKGFVLDHFRK